MCTRVLSCDVCVVISWFILVLMLLMSFVVAVPVSQLRASPRKGSNLLVQWMCVVGWIAAILWQMLLLSHQVVDVLDVGHF